MLCWVTVLGCAPAAQAFVYWGAAGSIGRAKADGSGADQTFITYGGVPSASVALDSSHIYWAQSDTGVERANLDGTGLKSNFIGTGHGNANAVVVNSSFVYWSEATGGIARANLDGTGINTSFITNVAPTCSGCSVVPTVLGVAVDGQHIYWAAFRTTMFTTVGTIGRANLDGSGADPGFITLPTNYEPIGMAVNGQRLYWSYGQSQPGGATYGIGSADIAGTGVNTNLVSVPGFGVGGIALDSSHIYWAEEGGGAGASAIGRANLDGSGANLGLITGLSAGAYSVAVDQSAPTVAINGTVQTFQGANPRTRGLVGVRVALDGTDHTGAAVHLTASTDTSGSYKFTGVQDGIYTVSPTGDPPAQASPFDDPPAGGRYVTTACDGAMTAGGCQIITATAPASAVASFVYGQDHTLKVTFSPGALPGDGLGQGTLTVADDARGSSPADGQWLWGRIGLPGTDPGVSRVNVHFLLCRTFPSASTAAPVIYPGSNFTAAKLLNAGPDGTVRAAVYAGSAGDVKLRVREPALNEDLTAAGGGSDPVPGSLTFADAVLGSVSVPAPGSSAFRRIEGLLDGAVRAVGGPAGLEAAPPAVAQQLLLDWLVAVKAAGMLPGIDFGPISTVDTVTAPHGHPAILFYPSGDKGIIDPLDQKPQLDTSEAGAVGVVLDIPTAFSLVTGGLKRALPTFNQWLAGLKIPATDSIELPPVAHGSSFYLAYFGWPYPPPPTIPDAALYYRCTGLELPSLQRVVVHSPVRLLITGAHGRALGRTGTGRAKHTLPGMFVAPGHGRPQLYEFLPGTDTITLTATGSGTAGVVFYSAGHQLTKATTYTFPVHRGQTGTITVTRAGPAHTLKFAGRRYHARGGLRLTIHGLPGKLPKHARKVTVTIRDQFGEIVPNVALTLTRQRHTTTTFTNARGTATVTLARASTPTVLRAIAPGYRTLMEKLK